MFQQQQRPVGALGSQRDWDDEARRTAASQYAVQTEYAFGMIQLPVNWLSHSGNADCGATCAAGPQVFVCLSLPVAHAPYKT